MVETFLSEKVVFLSYVSSLGETHYHYGNSELRRLKRGGSVHRRCLVKSRIFEAEEDFDGLQVTIFRVSTSLIHILEV